jgi:hypothetical protein
MEIVERQTFDSFDFHVTATPDASNGNIARRAVHAASSR